VLQSNNQHAAGEFWILKDGTEFERYEHPKWGSGELEVITRLNPGDSISHASIVFWNLKPRTRKNVAPEIQDAARARRLSTDYSFPVSGVYQVKAAYTVIIDREGPPLKIESEPIMITFSEPVGENKEVWDKIKDRGHIGYFLQEKDLPPTYLSESNDFFNEVQRLIGDHPNSGIINSMKEALWILRERQNKADSLLRSRSPQY
jgi:hypothetical protein